MVPLAVAIGAVVGLAVAAAALLSRPRRSVSQAIPPGVFARGTAASVDRPVDPTPQLVLGAVLGGAILVAVAFQLPSVLALFVSFLVIGVAAVLPAAGLAALIVLLPHQEPAVLGALGVKLPLLAALGYGLFVRSLAARQLPAPRPRHRRGRRPRRDRGRLGDPDASTGSTESARSCRRPASCRSSRGSR